MQSFWTPCGLTRNQVTLPFWRLTTQGSQWWRTMGMEVRCGRSYRGCSLTNVSSEWPTCSFTVACSQGKLHVVTRRSSAMCKKLLASGATSLHGLCDLDQSYKNNERRASWLTTTTTQIKWPKPIARTCCARLHSSDWSPNCPGVEA